MRGTNAPSARGNRARARRGRVTRPPPSETFVLCPPCFRVASRSLREPSREFLAHLGALFTRAGRCPLLEALGFDHCCGADFSHSSSPFQHEVSTCSSRSSLCLFELVMFTRKMPAKCVVWKLLEASLFFLIHDGRSSQHKRNVNILVRRAG